MKIRLFIMAPLVLAAAGLLLLAGCSSGASEEDLEAVQAELTALQAEVAGLDGSPSAPGVDPVDRFIEVTGFEIKGSTSSADLAPPDVDPSTLSDGFGFKGPGDYDADNPDKWQVATYMWSPGNMIANQGDSISLHFFIVNGNEHEVWVEGPDGSTVVDETEMNRGREYFFDFDVSQAGVYRLICNNHEPTMTAELVVQPQS